MAKQDLAADSGGVEDGEHDGGGERRGDRCREARDVQRDGEV